MFVGKGINTKFRMKTITISVISLQFVLLASIIVAPVLGKELLSNNIDSNKSMKKNVKSLSVTEFFNNNTRRTTVIPFTNQSTTPITKITTTIKRITEFQKKMLILCLNLNLKKHYRKKEKTCIFIL